MGKRSDFGQSWTDIVQDWCLGVAPSIPQSVGWAALGALERLWPERLDELLNSRQRGSAVVVPLIDDGLTIEACESLAGFEEVFTRWNAGDRGARSELKFAAALLGLGHRPRLQPGLEGKVLDAVISVAGHNVYFEVATPEYSDAVQQAFTAMKGLAARLAKENPAANISIYLLTDPLPEVCDRVSDYVRTLLPGSTPKAGVVQGTAHVRIAVSGEPLPPLQLQGEAAPSPVICSATAVRKEGVWGRADVCLPITDDRAETLLHRELSHFHRQSTNVLVLDISQVIGGMKSWVPLIKRRFQPTVNRRCGAVVLLERSVSAIPPAMNLNTLVLGNQYACRPVPAPLLEQLARIPNPWRT